MRTVLAGTLARTDPNHPFDQHSGPRQLGDHSERSTAGEQAERFNGHLVQRRFDTSLGFDYPMSSLRADQDSENYRFDSRETTWRAICRPARLAPMVLAWGP
jgi:hypothetical protein